MMEAQRKAVPTGPAHGGYDAVIFDMDGTLVRPMLDFAAIRAELGVPAGVGILEAIEAMPPDRQEIAHRVLLGYELAAARRAQPMHGALHTLQAVRAAGLKTALLTRNAAAAMTEVISRLGWRFDLAWSREQGPIKPQPTGVLRACAAMGVMVSRTMCVGDFEFDVMAANAAGAVSVLLAGDGGVSFAEKPRHVITALPQLLHLLGLEGS